MSSAILKTLMTLLAGIVACSTPQRPSALTRSDHARASATAAGSAVDAVTPDAEAAMADLIGIKRVSPDSSRSDTGDEEDDIVFPPDMTPLELHGVDPEDLRDAVVRVSRRNDRSGSSFMSPREQVENILRMAAVEGKQIARWFDESDSVSGKTTEREGLHGARDRALAGATGGIYTAKLDRYCRNLAEGVMALKALDAAGKEMRTAREGRMAGPNMTPTEKFVRNIFLTVGEWELDRLTVGFEYVTEQRVHAGINTTEPYGYRKDQIFDDRGKRIGGTRLLEPVPDEAPWVVEMFEKRKLKWSWQKIADWLNDEGVRTRAGAHWTFNSVKGIVNNRTYLGEVRSGDLVNEHAHTPIVGIALWNDANAHEHANPRGEKVEYELSGIIRCSTCGVKMVGRTNRKKRKDGSETVHRYYDCRRKHGFGKCLDPVRVRADIVEAEINRIFVERFINPCCDVRAEGVATGVDLEAALLVLQDADEDLRGFLASDATAELRRELGQSYVDDGMRARAARVKTARKAVTEAQNAMLGVEFPENLEELWETCDAQQRHRFLSKAFEIIAAHPDNVVSFWTVNEPGTPDNLPGRGVEIMEATPIAMRNAPAGAGVAAGQ